VAITVTVKNLGNTSTRPFYISFHLNDEYLPYGAVAMLRPNAVTEETFNLFIGEAGSYDVGIILDKENSISESDETNNSRTVTFSIAASPHDAETKPPAPSKSPGPRPAPIQLNPDEEGSSSELIFFVPVLLIVGILVFTILRARRKM
jgi:subtilase family serine protease